MCWWNFGCTHKRRLLRACVRRHMTRLAFSSFCVIYIIISSTGVLDTNTEGVTSENLTSVQNNIHHKKDTQSTNYTQPNKNPPQNACTIKESLRYSDQNVICCFPSGRFGNQMFIYASAYGIASALNMSLVFPADNYISEYLHLEADLIDMYRCTFRNTDKLIERLSSGYDENMMKIPRNRSTCVGHFLQSYKYFQHIQPDIKRQFKLKKPIQDVADEIVEKAVEEYQRRTGTVDVRPVLVGVHVRRGDRINYFFGATAASSQYMQNSTGYFRNKHKNVLFLVCSDSMDWVKENMKGEDVVYAEGNHFSVDFGVLLRCEHIISTVGSFGWWAGYLVGGETLYYKWPAREGSHHRKGFSQDYSDFFPSTWIGM